MGVPHRIALIGLMGVAVFALVPDACAAEGASSPSEADMIRDLSKRMWDAPRLRRERVQRRGGHATVHRLYMGMIQLSPGDDISGAFPLMQSAVRKAHLHSHRETLDVHKLLVELAEQYVARNDLAGVARVYGEVLKLGRYLPVGYTSHALNKLIKTHFDMGNYEAALMYVRIGIAVLDDVGVGPYRVMKMSLAPIRADPGDILRDETLHEAEYRP